MFVQLFASSRPRAWVYLAGPYLIGLLAAGVPFHVAPDLRHAFFLVYFLLPANLFLYAVSDVADAKTSVEDPEKNGYEVRLEKHARMIGLLGGIVLQIPLLLVARAVPPAAFPYLGLFLLLAITASVAPLRLKSRPYVDSAATVLYTLPGFFGYMLSGGTPIPLPIYFAVLAWCVAMHIWRDIPHIEADTNAGFKTTASMLGGVWTLRLCLFLFILASALTYPWLGFTAVAAGLVYAVVAIAAEHVVDTTRFMIFARFPRMNAFIAIAVVLQLLSIQLNTLSG